MHTDSLQILRREAIDLGGSQDVDAVLDLIGNARIVMLGEATHGTQQFYRTRAEISKRLIEEKGFAAIAVEADWPDALQVNRWISRQLPEARSASLAPESALGGFSRFPLWMWRNHEMLELVRYLIEYNQRQSGKADKAGFFGIDVYSLRHSMEAVVQYLAKVDPSAATRARQRYACFDHFGRDPQQYGYAVNFGMQAGCESEVVQQLAAMATHARDGVRNTEADPDDEAFYAKQHARVAANAESYYRTMFRGRDESWNVRDTHMADTLDALSEHLRNRNDRDAKLVVWAHNSHIGDARATEMGQHGQLNLGQLMRQRHGDDVFLLGFTTHAGTVTAASDWDGRAECKQVRPSLENSYERLFHETGKDRFLLPIRGNEAVSSQLRQGRLERAIGVVYLPERERYSHYFYADMSRQFDAVLHIDHTKALKPLDWTGDFSREELPETYPTGI